MELIRSRDMVLFENIEEDDLPTDVTVPIHSSITTVGGRGLPPQERNRQKGPIGCAKVLKATLKGTNIPENACVCFVEWHCGPSADWCSAVRLLQDEKLSGDPEALSFRIIGVGFCDNEEELVFIQRRAKNALYNKWWKGEVPLPTIGRIGPITMPEDQLSPPVPKPEFKIAYIATTTGNDERLVLPEAIDANFRHNNAIMQKWEAFREQHEKTFGKPVQAATSNEPELNNIPVPPHVEDQFVNVTELEPSRLISLPLQANKKIGVLICKKDGEMQVWLDGTMLDDGTVLQALDTYIFGFGLGTWGEAAPIGEGLPAIINNDLSYVTAIYEDGTRKVARACQILHDLEKVGKDGRFSFHTNPPMVDTETHRNMTGRYNIDVAKQVFFLPKTIDLTQRNTEDKQVSVHEVGALFKGCFGQPPSVHASVVWDTQVLPGTNASSAVVKFKQAKLFLVRDVRVKEGKAVRIL